AVDRVRAIGLAQAGDVGAEDVLHLGDQQLLVLLLVLDAGEHQETEPLQLRIGGGADQLLQARVDRLAEREDLVVARPGDEAAVVAPDARPQGLVIGVEDVFEAGVVLAVEAERLQDVLGEEPGGVPEVPPRRADVGHGLDAVVLGAQRTAELEAQSPGGAISLQKLLAGHGGTSLPIPYQSILIKPSSSKRQRRGVPTWRRPPARTSPPRAPSPIAHPSPGRGGSPPPAHLSRLRTDRERTDGDRRCPASRRTSRDSGASSGPRRS